MAVSKDIEKGTWTSQVWVEDWQGKKKHKKKRGFATKKEALEWEHSILLAAKADMNMKLADFVDLYFRDKETELKARTVRNKRYMIEQHILPMLGDKPMAGITPADIIQWQNYIRSKGFKETYQRMLQNQLTALFTHATKIYNLKDNPCAKVKRIGKADADKKQLQFWTLDEFHKFIASFEEGSRYHVLFDLLFFSGCRIGDDDDKIRLNQRKPSKYKGLSRFGPEKNLQRINKFMKERPIFYKNIIQMKENFRFYLRCFYCITKVVILQFNSENRTELARNG